MINDLVQGGAMPALELTMRFAAQRHRLIAHNIANADTPDFQPKDVSVRDFQKTLSNAIEKRRKLGTDQSSSLDWDTTMELKKSASGDLQLAPRTPQDNILFHDRNNRDLERLMQDNVENTLAFRAASELLRSRYDIIRTAISQRA